MKLVLKILVLQALSVELKVLVYVFKQVVQEILLNNVCQLIPQ